MRLLPDIGPLRHAGGFPRLLTAVGTSQVGDQLTAVAIAYQTYRITGSTLQVGVVSLTALIPLMAGSLIGGHFTDRGWARRTLGVALPVHAVVSAALAVATVGDAPPVAALYLYSAVAGALTGLEEAVYGALIPALVPPPQRPAANALVQFGLQLAIIGGPAVAGVLLSVSASVVYAVDSVSFLAALLLIAPIASRHRSHTHDTRQVSRADEGGIWGGVRALRAHPILCGVFTADLIAMLFGMPRAVFPALVDQRFHGSTLLLGYLFAAIGVGALIASLTSGWLSRIRSHGAAVLLAVAGWGAAVAAFGVCTNAMAALTLLAVAGYADIISSIMRHTVLQNATPPALMGRLSGLSTAIVNGGPRLGDVETGFVASLTNVDVSIISGGVACIIAVAALALRSPRFRRYTSVERARG